MADILNELRLRQVALDVGYKLLGTPYRWGGDDPMHGLDCSGYIIECLKSNGILPARGDWTAHDLYAMFPQTDTPKDGDLVFWEADSGRVIHVEMVFDAQLGLSIGASGGGSTTVDVDAAAERNAYVKIRP